MSITLKNLQANESFSEETLCFRATIYHNGKKVGTVENQGHGGCCNIHCDTNDQLGALETEAALLGEEPCYTGLAGSDGAMLYEHLSNVLMSIAEDMLHQKKIARLMRTGILFHIDGDHRDSMMHLRRPYTEANADQLRKIYADNGKTITILNEQKGGN